MRAIVLTGHGGLDKLVYREDVPVPQPRAGEVLVRVGACGVNNTDINTRTAWYDRAVESGVTEELGRHGREDDAASSWNSQTVTFPRIQGAAVAGRIAAVGSDVEPGRVGERVLVDPSVRDPGLPPRAQLAEYLGSERDGGFAEYAVVPSVNAHVIDTPLSDAELATFPCSYDTAEEMLERAGLAKGETVVVTGAAAVSALLSSSCHWSGARTSSRSPVAPRRNGSERSARTSSCRARRLISRVRLSR